MKVYLVGVGMGNPDTLTKEADRIIRQSDLLIGSKRMVELFAPLHIPAQVCIKAQDIVAAVRGSDAKQISVLLSGDTGFFSGAQRLLQMLTDCDVEQIPGISSLSYFCAKCQTSWQDVHVISCHGRDGGVVAAVQSHAKTFVLTGGAYRVQDLCRLLTQAGLGELQAWAGENLSYPNERICKGSAAELSHSCFGDLAVLLIFNPNPVTPLYQSPGLPDDAFCRGNVPMTKEEVRALVLSKLRLKENDLVWDVGAGTGSVSVECALMLPQGQVYAVERHPEGVALIEANKKRFALSNLQVISGHAPEALDHLPAPDKVFVGGSGGELPSILALALQKNPHVRIVISAITLETVRQGLDAMERWAFQEQEVVQVWVSRSHTVGPYHMMKGENPVYLISLENPR